MKTFKAITFVTVTTAVVSVITLFSVEKTKIEKDIFNGNRENTQVVEEKDLIDNPPSSSSDSLQINSMDSEKIFHGANDEDSDVIDAANNSEAVSR